jgi:hypothetical protein
VLFHRAPSRASCTLDPTDEALSARIDVVDRVISGIDEGVTRCRITDRPANRILLGPSSGGGVVVTSADVVEGTSAGIAAGFVPDAVGVAEVGGRAAAEFGDVAEGVVLVGLVGVAGGAVDDVGD